MASAVGLAGTLAIYTWTAIVIGILLHWKWRTAANGLRASYIAVFWPVIALGLAAYYLAAVLYTVAVIMRARRAKLALRR